MARDWVQWHAEYGDPASRLSQRRLVVAEFIRAHIDAAPRGPIRVLSLCCGDAGDLVAALTDHPRAADVTGLAIELDPLLAARAAASLSLVAPGLDVRCADAAHVEEFRSLAPVDLLLLVGIFGNINDDDIARCIAAAPALCRPGSTIVWTRHRQPPDQTPLLRERFAAAGCESLGFESPGEGLFGVGCERVVTVPSTELPPSLFTFDDSIW